MNRRAILVLLAGLAAVVLPARADDAALWALLRGGGQVVLVRHAVTEPGVGDPPGFRVEDCSTQRNLSEAGRREARRLGEALRARQVPVGELLTSPWCRCRETARLAFGREGRPEPALGNLFGRRQEEAPQVAALQRLVRSPAGGNVFMVTHGSTTFALTGVSPGTAEMVVLTPLEAGGFRVAGRLAVMP
ncbi:histidine phosphatase family protein [Ramlibacter sp. USB13]|uniref:Histidine phosphatase family protein n=1 Tax=Ramlibacter cellulosilyticus TaxID=2764187 RepID=A0A923SHH3_9BURK|nr:histidine phosphatase family protein [Ramlibacter cellulosilyticus]MBC5785907.1 histidine phosphatase family protein [Ramlibacter cellulosilyticus]